MSNQVYSNQIHRYIDEELDAIEIRLPQPAIQLNTTLTGNFTGVVNINLKYIIYDNQIQLYWNSASGTSSSGPANLVTPIILPVNIRPLINQQASVPILSNSINEIGYVTIGTSGILTFSRAISPPAFVTGINGILASSIIYPLA